MRYPGYPHPLILIAIPPPAVRVLKVFVYFIQAENGNIKIGSSARPKARLRTLQTGSPTPLRLIVAVEQTDEITEAAIHARFASVRLRGEWFQASPELMTFIASLG